MRLRILTMSNALAHPASGIGRGRETMSVRKKIAELRNDYKRTTAWMTAVGTLIAVGALFATLYQASLLRRQIEDDQERYRRQTALQLLIELEKSRPVNAAMCRRLVVMLLDDDGFRSLLNREPVTFSSNDLKRQAKACFSDEKQEDLATLFTNDGGLTNRGTSMLADRMNKILNADEDIAVAVNAGIAHGELIQEEMPCLIHVAGMVVNKVDDMREYSNFTGIKTQGFDKCVKEVGLVRP
jgi:hypothetical protein